VGRLAFHSLWHILAERHSANRRKVNVFKKRNGKKRICEDMQIRSVGIQYEKEDEESASILAKWDVVSQSDQKERVDHRERNGLRERRTVLSASMGRLVEV